MTEIEQLKGQLKQAQETLKTQTWGLEKTNEAIKLLYKEIEKKNKALEVSNEKTLRVMNKLQENEQRLYATNRALMSANEKLQTLDQMKSKFVADVSHEFRTPMTVIKEAIAQILDGLAGKINPKQRQMLEMGERSLDRLTRLVTDILDLSRIEADKVELKKEKVDTMALLNETFATFKIQLSKKQITFKKDIPQDVGPIWADKDKITQVVINLLNNAVKYTPAGGSITVGFRETDQESRFEISDTGPGISKENYQKIFDKYERITSEKFEKHEGTGLGLPISKDIIGLHKGRIWVESELGKGSKFIFTLPKES